MVRLNNWWIKDGHIYGKNLDRNGEYTRSPRSRELEDPTNDPSRYMAGDIISTFSANYLLVGPRRRKFSDD